jgi:hypothetical protein
METGLTLCYDIITSELPLYSSLSAYDYATTGSYLRMKRADKMHAENIEYSENDDMVAMNRQLAARAARASRSSDPPRS